jgi:hypothetical protein
MWQRSWQRKGHRVARGLGTVLCTAVVLGMGLLLAGWLVGCAELQYKAGDLYGWNCRPEALTKDGRCVASR